jgi:hypothetical protein
MKRGALDLPDIGHVPRIISRVPQCGLSGEQWGQVVDREFWLILDRLLSTKERSAVHDDDPASLPPSLFPKIDSQILHQAKSLGWRLSLSSFAHLAFTRWDGEDDGPEKFRLLGLAFAKATRAFQGKELQAVDDPDMWNAARETKRELRALLRAMRNHFQSGGARSSDEKLIEWFRDVVSNQQTTFPYLCTNIERWLLFLSENIRVLKDAAFGKKRQNSAAIYGAFIAFCTHHEQESLRQKLSKLGSLPSSKL